MPFLTQDPEGEQVPYGAGQTNWKFIAIVAVLAVVVGVTILYCAKIGELPQKAVTEEFSQKATVEELMSFAGLSSGADRVNILFRLEGTVKKTDGFFCDYLFVDTTGGICIANGIKNIDSYIDKPVTVEGYYYGYNPAMDPSDFFEIKKIEIVEKQDEAAAADTSTGSVQAWQTYRNEEYGLEFDYPSNWGELTLESKKNDNYNFNSSNKTIIEIKYYKPRGVLAFITKGTIHRKRDESVKITPEEGFEVCDYVLKVIYQNGQIKTIYTEENKPREDNDKIIYPYAGGKKIGGISFQPNEKYIRLGWSAYAWHGSYLLNMNTGKDILASYSIRYGDIYWSPDNKVLAAKSHVNEVGGDGVEGLFVSDYGNPEKLNEVFSIPHEKYSKGMRISVIGFIDSEHLSFEIFEIEEKLQEYTYNIKTKELRKRYIKILYPNDGEEFTVGESLIISWETENVEKIDIILSEKKDDRVYSTERYITRDFILTGENKYQWVIPEDLPPSKYALFILSGNGRSRIGDSSDDYFTISGTLSIQDKEVMLKQLIEGDFNLIGNTIIAHPFEFEASHLYKIFEGSFAVPGNQEYVFVLRFREHKYQGLLLGAFNKDKKLVSSPININELSSHACYEWGNGVDAKQYSCKGTDHDYVLTYGVGCPTGGWCSMRANLYRFENGEFQVFQDINKAVGDIKDINKDTDWFEYRGLLDTLHLEIEKDKILVYEWGRVDENFDCVTPDCIDMYEIGDGYKAIMEYFTTLFWDENECKFTEKAE